MKKSLIALLVVLALVVTMSVFTVSAEDTATTPDYTLSIDDEGVATAACPCPTHNGATTTFTEYTGQTAAGHYYMTETISKTAAMTTGSNATVVIHLNGNTLASSARVFNQNSAGKLYLIDKVNGGGIVQRTSGGDAIRTGVSGAEVYTYNVTLKCAAQTTENANGGVVKLDGGGKFYMNEGTVIKDLATAATTGGAIQIVKGTFTMNGGTIENCSAKIGGAIYLKDSTCTAIINGGTIKGCSATDRGGSVALYNGATLRMQSGLIDGGAAKGTQLGGNIYSQNTSNIEISGGTISNGYTWDGTTAPTVKYDETDTTKVIGYSTSSGAGRGGNIVARNATTITMTGGTVSGGSANQGGNISLENASTLSISNGTITGGYVGLFTSTNGKTSGGQGANVYAAGSDASNRAVVTLSGTGMISKGDAVTGAGVYVNSYATLTMTSGTISGGTSKNGGANIRTNAATSIVNISGGTIEEGTVTSGDGGNMFSNTAATINITGGSFIGGTATGSGANVCIVNAATTSVLKNATISGGTTSGTSKTLGATLYLAVPFAEISNMTFVGGKAMGSNANAGGVLLASGSHTIKNSTFTGGSCYGNGGALCLTTSGTTTLENCTLTGGIARYGANIFISNGTLNLVNTTSSKCGAGTLINGGGICVNGANAVVNMDTDSVITNNNVMHGGNVAVLAGTFNLNGGTISAGKATRNSTTAPYGGNVLVNGGTFNMNSGTITGGVIQNTTADIGGNGGNVYVLKGEFILNDGTITKGAPGSANALKGPMNGGNVYVAGGKFTMNGGTVSEGTAKNSGGNFYVIGVAADPENEIEAVTATLDINGGEITGGTAVTGGSIYIGAVNANVTIDDATISGGKATSTISNQGGGNIWNASGATAITNCTISGGVAEGAQGGNIYNQGSGLTVTGCRIEDGVAGKKVETVNETTDAETGEPVTTTTYSYPNGNGRGGNYAQVTGSATFTNCVITGGTNYSTTGGGGNVYVNGTIGETTFNGCTITDGFSQNNGGNFQHHAAGTVVITGDSYIAGGKLGAANWGANVSVTNGGAILKIDGETEINAKGCSGYGSDGGINIHVEQPNAQLHLLGDSRVVLGSVANYHSIYFRTIVRSGSSGNYTYTNGRGKVYLGGNAFMDKYVELFVWSTTQTAPADFVEVMEGFTGDALLISVYNSNFATADNAVVGVSGGAVNFGEEAPAYLSAAANYANTGTVKVHSQGRSGYVTVYKDGVFTIAPYTAFVPLNNGLEASNVSSHVEYGLANFDTLPAGTGYVKLYSNGSLTLNENLNGMPIDLNNCVVTIDTNGYTLAPIDYRTDGCVVSRSELTVTGDESKVQLVVKNPVTNYQYLNVKGANGKWTSNRVTVELTKVSIKTTKDGIYYTTKIASNANAAPYLVDYGTAVTVKPNVTIGENFIETAEADGIMWTAFDLNQTKDFSITTRSALISGILSNKEDADTNTERAQLAITANSFVTASVNGKEVKIMADESQSLSFETIMVKLDDKVKELNTLQTEGYEQTIETAAKFYDKWDFVFDTWKDTEGKDLLPNLKAEAAKVA